MNVVAAGWLGCLLLAGSLSMKMEKTVVPIVSGNGGDLVTEETQDDMGRMVRAITRDKQAGLWWIKAYAGAYPEGDPRHLYRIEAYLRPAVFTARLMRCRYFLCLRPKENSWGKGSPVFGDWSSVGAKTSERATVAPPEKPFTTLAAFQPQECDEPFDLNYPEKLSDEDVVGLADAMRGIIPRQRILHMGAINADSARIMGVSRDNRGSNLEIYFVRDGSGWKETRRGKWQW